MFKNLLTKEIDMDKKPTQKIDLWGGIECTINRVGHEYFDQFEYSGHYSRNDDIEQIATLGIKKLRYALLWERYLPQKNTVPDWNFARNNLNKLRDLNIIPIVGLVHHGSGPNYVNFFDGSFENELARYALLVAKEFPWIEYFTPVNEPLTTARFCGLYGLWYPHEKNDYAFARILVSECKGIVMAMYAIRSVNPNAKLIQTDDLVKVHSTPSLEYQSNFENERRWLAFDLISGKVNPDHPMWSYLIWAGIDESDLYFFLNNYCEPDIIGLNYYVTSERYIDDNLENYPAHTHGRNHFHAYADVEAVRVNANVFDGPYTLLKETSQRFSQPLAVTEVHLHCHREEQMRWFSEVWHAAVRLKNEGVNIEAVTAWSLLGSFGWNKLLTVECGDYEPGVFDVSSGRLRPTATAHMLKFIAFEKKDHHPVLQNPGWWKRDIRIQYQAETRMVTHTEENPSNINSRPLLILGKTGTLGNGFARICQHRNIHYKLLGRDDMDISKPEMIQKVIEQHNAWAIVNAAGYVRVDDAEKDRDSCFLCNTKGPMYLAKYCAKYGIQLLSFSSDLVFDGKKLSPYYEGDPVNPLNIYGWSKARAEEYMRQFCPNALIVRTSAFFGPWDNYNFITSALESFKKGEPFAVAKDVVISPTYIPDLVHTCLDLLIDKEKGIWHIANDGEITWADFAIMVSERSGHTRNLLDLKTLKEMQFIAQRPYYSVLKTQKGIKLPRLENALDRYFAETGYNLHETRLKLEMQETRA